MTDSPHLRAYAARARELERQMRTLIDDITTSMTTGRERRRIANDKVDVMFVELEDMLFLAEYPTAAAERDSQIHKIHHTSDQAVRIMADIDRVRRATYRGIEDAEMDRRVQQADQVRREADAELLKDKPAGG